MHRSPLLGFALLLLVPVLPIACGNGQSESPILDAGADTGPGPQGDGGGDAGCGPEPSAWCPIPCGGGTTEPICADGYWQCPEYGYGECPIEYDGGSDSGGCTGEPLPCPTYCGGQTANPICVGNQWACIADCIEDGGPPDAEVFPDAPSPLFACGDISCDPSTSYCEIFSGGAVKEDGGTSTSYSCPKLPTGCTPGAATCACVQGIQGAGCDCVGGSGKVIETCEVP